MGLLQKQPGESILFDFSFDGVRRIGLTDTISNVISVVPDDNNVTISTITHDSDKVVQFRAVGGLDGTTVKITITVNTAGGDICEDEMYLLIKER